MTANWQSLHIDHLFCNITNKTVALFDNPVRVHQRVLKFHSLCVDTITETHSNISRYCLDVRNRGNASGGTVAKV